MQIEYLLILNSAFLASISHCAGMCGGFCTLINAKASQNNQKLWVATLLYNLGRLGAYMLIGALCGGLGLQFQISSMHKAISTIGIGGLVVFFALLMLFLPKTLAFLEPNLSQTKGFKKLFCFIFQSKHYGSFVGFGFLNGFLPCGIVYYFALVALASGGVIEGVLVMLLFGICTFVPMLSLGVFSGILFNLNQYRIVIFRVGMCLMCVFGMAMMYKGYRTLQMVSGA